VHKLIIVGMGLAAAAILMAGCGGDGADDATAQVSKSQFMTQARDICEVTQKKMAPLLLSKKARQNPDRFKEAASLLKREAEELEAIEGPKQVEADVEPLIANIVEAGHIISTQGEEGVQDPRIAAYKREARRLHLTFC